MSVDQQNYRFAAAAFNIERKFPSSKCGDLRARASYNPSFKARETFRAHNAVETADQRAAIADSRYWLHQYVLLTQAQANVTAKA